MDSFKTLVMWTQESVCDPPRVPAPQCKRLVLRCWGCRLLREGSTGRSHAWASYVFVCDLGMGGVAAPHSWTPYEPMRQIQISVVPSACVLQAGTFRSVEESPEQDCPVPASLRRCAEPGRDE